MPLTFRSSIYSPSIDVVDRLSKVLGVEAADLLSKSEWLCAGCID
jgi:hypothetical protein